MPVAMDLLQPSSTQLTTDLEQVRAQWRTWASNERAIPKRQRKRAVDVALASLHAGATAEQAATAGRLAAKEAYAAYYASASLVCGVVSVLISLTTGGVTLLFGVMTVYGGIRGLKSYSRRWQAITGLVLGAISGAVFIAAHALVYLARSSA